MKLNAFMKSPIVTMGKVFPLLLVSVLVAPRDSLALGQERYVEDVPGPGSFPIVQGNVAATIYVDSSDFAGVVRAANDLQADVARVTSHSPAISHAGKKLGENVIIVGTIGKSQIIDQLIREGKIDVSPIAGKWESFFIQVVPKPLPGVASATGHLRQRQARDDLRHLRFVRTDGRVAVVLVGRCARPSIRTRCL